MVQQFHGGKLVPLCHPTPSSSIPPTPHRKSTSSSKWRPTLIRHFCDMAQSSQILRHSSAAKDWLSAQECHDHSKDFPRDDNISAGSVLSRISSLVCARTYLLFVFVLKHSSTTISLVPKNGETCENATEKYHLVKSLLWLSWNGIHTQHEDI